MIWFLIHLNPELDSLLCITPAKTPGASERYQYQYFYGMNEKAMQNNYMASSNITASSRVLNITSSMK